MNYKIALVLLLGACAVEPDPAHVQVMAHVPITVEFEAAISFDDQAAFARYAQRNIAVWNDGLVGLGCEAPFEYVSDFAASRTSIVLASSATFAAFPPNGGGYFDGHRIFIHADSDGTYNSIIRQTQVITLQHELGHALGLPHNMRDDSVMSTQAFVPVGAWDLEQAAESIECER